MGFEILYTHIYMSILKFLMRALYFLYHMIQKITVTPPVPVPSPPYSSTRSILRPVPAVNSSAGMCATRFTSLLILITRLM